jgi:hypothetical protein
VSRAEREWLLIYERKDERWTGFGVYPTEELAEAARDHDLTRWGDRLAEGDRSVLDLRIAVVWRTVPPMHVAGRWSAVIE